MEIQVQMEESMVKNESMRGVDSTVKEFCLTLEDQREGISIGSGLIAVHFRFSEAAACDAVGLLR